MNIIVERDKVIERVTDIVACLNTSDSIGLFLLDIHCILQKVTYADNFYVVLRKEDGSLSFPYFHDVMDDIRAEDLEDLHHSDVKQSLTGYALTTQQVCNFTREDIDALIADGKLAVIGTMPKQWLCFPLINRQNFMGAFIIQSYRRSDEYSGMIVDILFTISHVISSALDAFHNQQALMQANQALALYRIELEERVLQRTRELEKSLAELRQEVDKRRELQKQLEFDSLHDNLTGLANRKYLFQELSRVSAKSQRGAVIANVIYIDLDDFKPINDQFGHQSGDEVLKTVADRLKLCVRSYDMVSRLGGDEFVVMVVAPLTHLELEELATRLLTCINEPVVLSCGASVSCGASIGMVSNHLNPFTAEALLHQADSYLLKAKTMGKNQFIIALQQ
ncbi:diguanylate cyclase [Pseudoalteromonas fenneropenaei]|uniref:Diguanylate cyclase n=1 Tax=Pseudoalteromonas fenneropenaei TaxID=1737459 RepID=A0ABV7CPY8_9GAMM